MNVDQLARMLEQSAADAHLTSSERPELRAAIQQSALNEQSRAVLRARAFDIARSKLQAAADRGSMLGWLEDVNKLLLPPGDAHTVVTEAHFSPGDECLRRIVALLGAARSSVDICVFTISDDRITSVIDDTFRRGVAVRIITDNDKVFDAGSDVQGMAQRGIPVRVDDSPYHMHHKFAVYDNAVVLTGSYNWTRGAALNNEENLVISNDAKLVSAFRGEFDRLWNRFAAGELQQ